MAGTQVVSFLGKQVPGFVKDFTATNIDPRNLIPQLSIKGKVWRTVIGGKETKLTRVDNDGDRVPVNVIRLVVLQHNKARSRAYYEGDFDGKKPVPPACWSSDGVTPDESVHKPQAKSCAKCPQAVKGAKVTDNGKEVAACSQFKRLAVKPSACFNPDADEEAKAMPALLLKLPQTSLWDKNAEEQNAAGWFAWDQFCDYLRGNGVNHTGLIEVKAKFDPDPAYPKVLFAASRYLTQEEFEAAKPLFDDPEVAKLLAAPEIEVASNRKPEVEDTEDEEEEAAPAPKKKAAPAAEADEEEAPAPKKKAKPVVVDDEEEAPAPKKKAAPVATDDEEEAPAPKPKKKVVVAEDDDTEAEAPAPKKKAAPVEDEEEAPAPKKKPKVATSDDDDELPPPKKAKAVVADDDDELPPPKKAAPVADDSEEEAPAPKKKVKAVVEDDEEEAAPPPKKKAKAAPADDEEAPAPKAEKNSKLKALLAEWPDDE